MGHRIGKPHNDIQSMMLVIWMTLCLLLITRLPDSLRIHLHLRGGVCGHQNLNSLILRPRLSNERLSLQNVHILWILSFHFLPRHHLDHNGKLLQACVILLDAIFRGKGKVHQHQQVLSCPGDYQYDCRCHRIGYTHPADSAPTDVNEEEGSCMWHHASW